MDISLTKQFDPSQNQTLLQDNEKFYFPQTRFNFIQNHNGFRPSCLHVLLGTTGAGKTTLTRTILQDICKDKKVLWYSTEETHEQFQAQNAYSGFVDYENIRFFSEHDVIERLNNDTSNLDGFIKQFEWAIAEHAPDIIFFDNITTSVFYDQNPKAKDLTLQLRSLIRRYNFPMFLVAHTGSHIKENQWFSAADIRGVRNIAVTAEYLYCLMRFRAEREGQVKLWSFVHVDKSRLHGGGKEVYRLAYDQTSRTIISDTQMSYDAFREFVKGHSKLV